MKTVLLSLSTLLAGAVVAAPVTAQGPTDPQIAAIVVAANQVDIDAGHLAVRQGRDAQVKAFARQMITDHSAVNAAAVKLVTKLHVTPEANATSKQLTDGGVANRKKLTPLHGAAFDKAYIDNEVAYHQAVLDAIDKTLIPNAKNAELKALLEQTRPAIAAHLDHAKQIQASLKG
jgi:putative membrane protein